MKGFDDMSILYSQILPMTVPANQSTIADSIKADLAIATEADIAVGYVSGASLVELGNIVRNSNIKRISLIIGMYYHEGMPEGCYRLALELHEEWTSRGIGEVRLVIPMKYHGKSYVFYKDDVAFSAVIGSANLSVLKPDASTLRQYELAYRITSQHDIDAIAEHCRLLKRGNCSRAIDTVSDMTIIPGHNTALDNIVGVQRLTPDKSAEYRQAVGDYSFALPLKVPAESEKLLEGRQYFTKSNINVCYCPDTRNKKRPPKARNWYECQLTVASTIYSQPGYPAKNDPFYLITDDGYKFLAHTTSDHNKQFAAVGDESIMGRWLKGRLVAAGLVNPVNNTLEDTAHTGMITKEILKKYGRDVLIFRKANMQERLENGTLVDVWLISFESSAEA